MSFVVSIFTPFASQLRECPRLRHPGGWPSFESLRALITLKSDHALFLHVCECSK